MRKEYVAALSTFLGCAVLIGLMWTHVHYAMRIFVIAVSLRMAAEDLTRGIANARFFDRCDAAAKRIMNGPGKVTR